jgi:phosphopantothenoylcysteine decarboxylase/phosphopantothenate--cysteine ligase
MGYALATEARDRGAHVILISGHVVLDVPYGVEVRKVETAIQMRDAVFDAVIDADVLVMSAAVADFRPAEIAEQKLKKREKQAQGEQNGFSLQLVRTPDILSELAHSVDEATGNERSGRSLVRVGFAAETDNLIAYASEKLVEKHLDLLVANDVSRSDSGFGTDTNKVEIFHANGIMEDLPVMPKTGVAAAIWDRIVSLLRTR